ncbi:Predicted transcriptional regulator, ArsR family [Actinomyces ruminicola]|uniref:Predicted transcriptional regulator, ArsR family n=1 Tax=Actinomyces ruminicola TaxID=332524 RepID=A0A1H0DMY1_9ACTO|nr:helix-turn-helix domain-containing protein [Actinomyces ruminicola]SDN71428.1 Predicted transcriptional regulator, ArsR family [Actinomyces ruminicola]
MSVPLAAAAHLPRPAWADLSARAELSQARRRVLEEIEHASHPLTAAQVARALDLHHNTVREHLDALVEAGLVTVSTSSTGRRGRPALRYAPAGPDPAQVVGSYLALLDAIVDQLGDGEQARQRALAIGRRWAQLTPADPAAPSAQAANPAAQLEALLPHLSVMGFAPEFDGEQVVLKACPLVTSSRPPHALVCLMHQGFLNERYGKAPADAPRSDDAVDGPAGSIRFSVTPLCADGCHVTATAVTEAAPAHAKRFPALKR